MTIEQIVKNKYLDEYTLDELYQLLDHPSQLAKVCENIEEEIAKIEEAINYLTKENE